MSKKIVKIVLRDTNEGELVCINLDGLKEPIWMSVKEFNEAFKGSALPISNDAIIETKFSVLLGGELNAVVTTKNKDEEYVIDENSSLALNGAWEDGITVKRDGKKVTLKKGDKAKVGDIGTVYSSGIRIDRTEPVTFEPNYKRLQFNVLMAQQAAQLAKASSMESISFNE